LVGLSEPPPEESVAAASRSPSGPRWLSALRISSGADLISVGSWVVAASTASTIGVASNTTTPNQVSSAAADRRMPRRCRKPISGSRVTPISSENASRYRMVRSFSTIRKPR
jgi:hypothetical protein